MVPLSALTNSNPRYGPEFTMRYNLYRSAQIIGSAAPGYSSAQAMKALEETFDATMPPEMGYDYMGMSFQEKKSQQGVPTMGDLRCFTGLRLPDPGGAVWELDAAVQRSAQHSCGAIWSLRGALAATLGDGAVIYPHTGSRSKTTFTPRSAWSC